MFNYGIKIQIDKGEASFLKLAETLTRIGILSNKDTLVQTCHILHKRGEYYILHFKELFAIDGTSKTEISEEDILRRNGIAKLLVDWKLCTTDTDLSKHSLNNVRVISHANKSKYILKKNYTIGK